MMWLWWAIPLVLMVFLWTLNEFLQGRLNEIISGLLAFVIFVFVGIAFVVSGWKVGIGALFGSFALSNLLRPLALAVARRIIPYPDLGFDEYSRRRAERTMADFGTEAYFKRHRREEQKEARHKDATVATAMKVPEIAEVLARFDATERDLVALYDRIEVSSLPPKIRRTVLENPALVAYFLEDSEPSETYDGTYARGASSIETHLLLQLWTRTNPGGKMP